MSEPKSTYEAHIVRQRGRGPQPRKTATGDPVRPGDGGDLNGVSGPTWCDTREAAAILGCLPDGVARLVEAGELIRHRKPGRFPFYSRREVQALAANREEARS